MFLAKKLNKGAGTPAVLDAQFNYVTMLLHGDGTNGAQNNTFLDSSTNEFSITRNGNTTQGSFSPYGSNWSNYFGGADYLSLADNANLNPGTQDFVMEAWVYLTGTTGNNQGINGKGTPGTDGYTFFVTNALVLSFIWNGTGGATITGGTLVLNTWNHVAVVRNSSVIRLYLNGVGAGSSTACTTDITSTATKFVGQARGGNPILGYMSNYRMTKGSLPSGYDATSSSLTPPTAPLTAISGTSLLTCQSNRFADNSASPLTITVNGTPSVQRFNPFGASTAYSTSVIGGSGYFDGSGDYLSLASNAAFGFGTGDFTVEFWLYVNSFTTYQTVVATRESGSPNDKWSIAYASDGSIYLYSNTFFGQSALSVIKTGTWTHVAIVRASSSIKTYVNGTQSGSTSSNTQNFATSALGVGAAPAGTEPMNGYISNLRLVKGTAVYTANFTPPTAPVTAISGTSLLTNFTNGAIFDNAMMNDLETVGNAQISTSVKKYGTGSMYFDGTGDYLKIPYSPNLQFGTGAYTLEFWLNTSSVSQWLVFNAENNSGIRLYVQSNGTLELDEQVANADNNIYSTATVNDGAWHHIALSRAGGAGTKMFVDGIYQSQQASAYNFNDSVPYYIGTRSNLSGFLTGYIDDLRITKGYARYTANFTPPTAAFFDTGPT
jgi:hypothetical protein